MMLRMYLLGPSRNLIYPEDLIAYVQRKSEERADRK